MLAAYEQKAITDGFCWSVLSSEIAAIGFYQNAAMRSSLSPFEEDGILCVKMGKIFAKTKEHPIAIAWPMGVP